MDSPHEEFHYIQFEVRRLFSTFPTGWPGLGLLLLRTVVASAVIHTGAQFLAAWPELNASLIVSISFATGLCLLLGVITPLVSLIVVFSLVVSHFFGVTAPNGFVLSGFVVLRVATLALAIALVGPGAFSFDARIFGRREIRIPR
jgi:uncharacterized membrane protein YphA (DoxX/SURF4 family)